MAHTAQLDPASATLEEDFLPINGTDYIEYYVGNAKQAAYYYQNAFGFQLAGYKGPETGCRETASYLLMQGKIRLILTTPLRPGNFIADHIYRHGDGIRDIALWVDDARKALEATVHRGATVVRDLTTLEDAYGRIRTASISAYGDTIHSFVERKDYQGFFMPGYVPRTNPHWQPTPIGLMYVDHVVGNVDLGDMNRMVDFYANVMGFKQLVSFDDTDISTEYSALMSKVMSNGNERIKFPINEPAAGKKKSQIEEYLDFYQGAGAQHIALATDNILFTVSELRRRGVEFLHVPTTYYDDLQARVGAIDEDMGALRDLGILVDRDDEGYLLQIFTKPVEDRPTVFYELIQRKGARSFGKGNFKALFEAIEREQALRGNL
jgi:4-hydroxyphenylpyruvate dioxygenase